MVKKGLSSDPNPLVKFSVFCYESGKTTIASYMHVIIMIYRVKVNQF